MPRIIAHLDMDAFFAAAEERDNPRFAGLPVVVGADPHSPAGKGKGRGVVSTANYKAREYGIRSALPISKAWRLSEDAKKRGLPPAVFLPGDFEKYSRISSEIMAIVREYSPLVEEASVDEAYFDLSAAGSLAKAEKICRQIKKEIKEKERLTCSIGIGPNKLIAKIASDFKKPDGLTAVSEQEAEKFLEPLPIRKIPGVGPKTEEMFRKIGVKSVRDAKKFSAGQLREMLGKWGTELREKIRGRDDAVIQTEYEIKSIGEQETFAKDTLDPNFIFGRLEVMGKNVIARFAAEKFASFKTVCLIVRFADFETKTRAHTLKIPANSEQVLKIEAIKLLLPFLDRRENPKLKPIRLLGVRIEKFYTTENLC